ncbi:MULTISPECIES: DUF334 domain-containing protein [Staphylococcus]|uniref:DUF334 domain-containing protein n=1 Tax=Staphylococcus TaxID=1279 RepID=UPI001AEC1355|nr:DUF334 domain-containing protein [Staphylococcus sp. GDY8P119P]
MKRLEEIESRENKKERRHNELIENLEGSTSNFRNAVRDVNKQFVSAAKIYVNRLNTDNQEQDFQQALDTKFKDIDDNTNQLITELKESNQQVQKEIQEYKKTMENKVQNNNKLIEKYNKTLNKMTQGVGALFFVVLIVALVSLVTGPIGDILMINSYAESIHDQIVQSESIWRYLAYLFYLIPFVILLLILWLCTKFINALDQRY